MFWHGRLQLRQGRRLTSGASPGVAGILALFVLLQGFISIGASLPRPALDGGEKSVILSLIGTICEKRAPIDEGSPASAIGHAQCCALCRAASGYEAPLTGAAQICDAINSDSGARVPVAWRIICGDSSRPAGWASAWSQQGPPSLS